MVDGVATLLRTLSDANREIRGLRREVRRLRESRDLWRARAHAAEWGLVHNSVNDVDKSGRRVQDGRMPSGRVLEDSQAARERGA